MSTKVIKNSEVRYGVAYWNSELGKYFPVRAVSLGRCLYANRYGIVLWPSDFVHDAREYFESRLGCSCIVYVI